VTPLTHRVHSGTTVYMTERRPRIKPEIAADIERRYPHSSFEGVVNMLLLEALAHDERTTREALLYIAEEHLQMDIKAFRALYESVYEEVSAELDRQAREDEMSDEEH
jgi:hypothetical protein